MSRACALAVATLVGCLAHGAAWAQQDDVALPMAPIDALFAGGKRGEVRGLTAADGRLDLGFYTPPEGAHAYHGVTAGRLALVNFGGDVVWLAGLSSQTVADKGNDLGFRLTRLFYDFRTGVDMRLGDGVLRAHWIHRCSHGVDGALEGRILIRNGLDLAYRWDHEGRFGRLEAEALGHVTVLGQNDDLASHNRGLFSGRLQWSHEAGPGARILVGAGLGAMIVARGEDWEYTVAESADDTRLEWLPALVLGGVLEGRGGRMTVLFSSSRIADDGVGATTRPADLRSVRILFGW